jgi:signal transduction histidine kinase
VTDALVLATVVVPAYTGLLHGWIHLQRRRDTTHLWLAVTAFGLAVIAGGVIGHAGADSLAQARRWQNLQMAAGAVLLVGFVRWLHAFLGRHRPVRNAAAVAVAGLTLLGVALDATFSHQAIPLVVLPGGPPVPMAVLSPFGLAILAGFVYFVGDAFVELVLAARTRADVRPAALAYLVFAATLVHDAARGAALLDGPQLLAFGYLVMVLGFSSVQVRRFVRSMAETERLASHLHERVEERSEVLRRKELQLIDGERLATLGTLAAGVAHEINDPMAFVSSSLNRVEEIWSDPAEGDDVPEILAECREGIGRMRATVAELLRLARGGDARSLPVDLAAVVASVMPMVRTEARGRAELYCELAPVPPVSGDPGLLAQVALQLLLNAIRAGSAAADPAQAAGPHRIHVSTDHLGDQVRLRVRDAGAPLPPELLPHLFDPFASFAVDAAARAERTTAGGARLGLAVSHRIVRQHGGEISVSSTEDGTEVVVSLPEAPPAPG